MKKQILSVLLCLCMAVCLLPAAVLAASDLLLTNGDVETGDGTGWNPTNTVTVEKDAAAHTGTYGLHFNRGTDAGQNWGTFIDQTAKVEAGTYYQLSFWMKNVAAYDVGKTNVIYFKNGSGTDSLDPFWFNDSGNDWIQKTYVIKTPADCTSLDIVLKATDASIYLDDMVLQKMKISFDGYLYNGDFETGSPLLWMVNNDSFVEKAAAKDGDYGLHLKGGEWAGMYQTITVKPSTEYMVTFDAKALTADQIGMLYAKNVTDGKDEEMAKIEFKSSTTKWTPQTLYFTTRADITAVNILFFAQGAEKYIDNVVVKPSDALIKNGLFETGDAANWIISASTPHSVSADGAHSGGYGLLLSRPDLSNTGDDWGLFAYQEVDVEPDTDYQLSFWMKNYSAAVAGKNGAVYSVNMNDTDTTTNSKAFWFNDGETDWVQKKWEFHIPVGCTKMQFFFRPVNGAFYVDDIVLNKMIHYSVTGALTNLAMTGESSVALGTDYTAVLTPDAGFVLPDSIAVTVGGTTLTGGYTYDSATGALTVDAAVITGDVEITASGAAD